MRQQTFRRIKATGSRAFSKRRKIWQDIIEAIDTTAVCRGEWCNGDARCIEGLLQDVLAKNRIGVMHNPEASSSGRLRAPDQARTTALERVRLGGKADRIDVLYLVLPILGLDHFGALASLNDFASKHIDGKPVVWWALRERCVQLLNDEFRIDPDTGKSPYTEMTGALFNYWDRCEYMRDRHMYEDKFSDPSVYMKRPITPIGSSLLDKVSKEPAFV